MAILALIAKNVRIKRRKWASELCIVVLLPVLLSVLAMALTLGSELASFLSQENSYDPSNLGLYFPLNLPYGILAVVDPTHVAEDIIANIQFGVGVKPTEAVVRLSSQYELNSYCAQHPCVGGVVFVAPEADTWNYILMADTFTNALLRNWPEAAPSPHSVLPFLQNAIDTGIMKQYSTISKSDIQSRSIYVMEVESGSWLSNAVKAFNEIWSSMFFGTMFGPVVFALLSETTREKELRLKESMFMMGLTPFEYVASWFITNFVEFLPAVLMTSSILATSFPTPLSIGKFLPLTLLCNTSTICLSLLVDIFVSSSRVGPVIGVFILGLQILTSNLLLKSFNLSSGTLGILAFFVTPVSWTVGLASLTQENASESEVLTKGLSFNVICTLLVLQICFYSALGWYLSHVVPHLGGTAKSPLFIFKPSYWFPKRNTSKQPLDGNSIELSSVDDSRVLEPLPVNADIGISIRHLGKLFRHPQTGASQAALVDLSLEVQKGTVLALLGKNGAGKTTFISILTGLLKASTGDALINGESILEGKTRKPTLLGVCPQHETIFPTLTVTETFRLYAGIKRIPRNEVDDQIQVWLKSTNLSEHRNVLAGHLSGGQKRRLAVGIAFMGDPQVVILDEMSSGVDPVSRRGIWEIIQKERKSKTIILTSHFLDEAEALADRIAILREGNLKCVGSLWFLKKAFGAGYNLTVVLKDVNPDGEIVDEVDAVVKSNVQDAELVSFAGSEVQYHLSENHVNFFGQMIRQLECLPSVDSFGLSVTTLEEVFMRVNNTDEVKLPETLLKGWDEASRKSDPVLRVANVRPRIWKHVLIMAHKVLISAGRDKWLLASRIMLPLCAVGLSMYLLKDVPSYNKCSYVNPSPSPSAESLLSPSVYVYPSAIAKNVTNTLRGFSNFSVDAIAGDLQEFITAKRENVLPPTLNLTTNAVTSTIIVSSATNSDQDLIVALQNIAANTFLQSRISGVQINATVQRFTGSPRINWNIADVDQLGFLFAMFFYGLSGLAGAKLLVTERLSGAKFQQYISGS
ncbi:UNVERIFIED_CONTAM: hypothetical protein HDU68_012252 [Siphonaria sp. JEL0065]|nr:hypothetical protein HDU68_012252 [Siphonaria sp. JEL0065]